MVPKILVVADDLTGAMDTSAQFAARGLKTEVLLKADLPDTQNADVLAIDTKTRNVSASQAKTMVRRAIEPWIPKLPKTMFFKKIDSTFRGNVGYEIDVVMEATDLKMAIIAPAFPANGRTVIGGYMLVDQTPLMRSYAGKDVLLPVHSSFLPELLACQTARTLAMIPFRHMEKGGNAVFGEFRKAIEKGSEMLLFDSCAQEDLTTIVKLVGQGNEKIMWVGSAALAGALADQLIEKPAAHTCSRIIRPKGKTLVLFGSANPVCHQQLIHLREHLTTVPIKPIPSGIVLGTMDQSETAEMYTALLNRDNVSSMVVNCSNLPFTPSRVEKEPLLIRNFLSIVAKKAVEQANVTNLIISGGDTARAIFEHLNITKIELETELLPGVPIGRARRDDGRDLMVMTKAGGFGPPDMLTRILGGVPFEQE